MKELHRPYIRQAVRNEVERRAEKENGQFCDANTGKVIEGQYDLGHIAGNEFWREKEQAESEGLTQEEFNDRMNDPNLYQIEDPSSNRSHKYEKPRETEQETEQETQQETEQETEQETSHYFDQEQENEFEEEFEEEEDMEQEM
ncbi:MAG: HNH/ENDO VII family nuclease [Firmicutes bacterium]|nr:HNH/ENDO VII family nuclease [Bacillota bacterium]